MKRLLVAWMTFAFAFALDARASIREVRPGRPPNLAADEGLLVAVIDASERMDSLHISREGSTLFGGETIDRVAKGVTTHLYAVTAGRYRWNSILNDNYRYNLQDDPELHFEVKPGAVNYAGDFIYRPVRNGGAKIHTANRSLRAMDWVRVHDPDVYKAYRFDYSGHYADAFPAFYAAQRELHAAVPDGSLDATLPVPDPGALPIDIGALWRNKDIGTAKLSPDGALIVESVNEDQKWHVDVIDLESGTQDRVYNTTESVVGFTWVDDRILGITWLDDHGDPHVNLLRIGEPKGSARTYQKTVVFGRGLILAALRDHPGEFLLETGGSESHVLRLDAKTLKPFEMNWYSADRRQDPDIDGVRAWWVDRDDRLRAALVARGDAYDVLYGSGATFQPILHLPSLREFLPLRLSPDGKVLYGLGEAGRPQRELLALDTASHALKTVFSRPGIDVEAPLFDRDGVLVGVRFVRDGVPTIEYIDPASGEVAARVARDFPGANAFVLDHDASARRYLVRVERSDQLARFIEVDRESGTVRQFDDLAPDLAGRLSPTKAIHAKAGDGTAIEAYLTTPLHASGRVPLVVYTHGGPIGVRDTIAYDPAVQLFASLGYAVLQVNFRGSEGYGRAFEESGRRHYGSVIEDDIDAATRKVLAEEQVDPDRVCAVGASYGGYSALVSAIRWPRRFRCVVSVSGVSDQALMFTASDFGYFAEGRKALEHQIGDPVADGDMLRSFSPLFRYAELTAPVMLAHGTEDVRVDYEHTRRMARMLALAGRPVVLVSLEGEGHGGFKPDSTKRLWTGIAGFLRLHLDEAQPKAPAAHQEPQG